MTRASTQKVKKTELEKPVVLRSDIDVVSCIQTTFNNELGKYIARGIKEGYELMTPPIFTHRGEPANWNGAAVGYQHPHFLVLLAKRSK